jgi:NADH:ubiquinone oxidoreductase subunit B-like Fe-S oxidoreductase
LLGENEEIANEAADIASMSPKKGDLVIIEGRLDNHALPVTAAALFQMLKPNYACRVPR